MTNLAVAQALAGSFSHVLIDEKAHPSLADAAEFLNCPVLKFKHRNVDDLAAVLERCGSEIQPILLTDGMFSHDGSIAPLKRYHKLLPRSGWMMVDDAHGAGTLGATGKGTVETEGVSRKQLIQCITLSKAFGAYGGAIVCDRNLREKIFTRSRLFVGNTPLPLPLANAALTSIKVLKQDKSLRQRLEQNVKHVKSQLRNTKWPVPDSLSPVVPILPGDDAEAEALKARCLANQVYPSFIKYPGGPRSGYFRFVISSEHTKKQLDALVKALR
jgi:7-keto-8-aminopelargonate synthetase-like enzyme